MSKAPPKIGLVIFDCDGVLVDSEPIAVAELIATLAEAGIALSPQAAYRHFLGRSAASAAHILAEEFGVVLSDAALSAMRARLAARFKAELQPIRGIKAAIAALGQTVCVASSSQPERIRLALETTGLLAAFEPRIFSAAMVAHGKPAPDLFLHAAEKTGFLPEECLVIEDSPAGIEAAQRAHMRVFGFAGGGHAEAADLARAIARAAPLLIFEDMKDLPRLIGVNSP